MPGRSYTGNGYRYGFNGKEKDDEVKGDGNNLDLGARVYDSRLGRCLSIDRLTSQFPFISPYHYVNNNPVVNVERDGNYWLDYRLCFVGTCPLGGEGHNGFHQVTYGIIHVTKISELQAINIMGMVPYTPEVSWTGSVAKFMLAAIDNSVSIGPSDISGILLSMFGAKLAKSTIDPEIFKTIIEIGQSTQNIVSDHLDRNTYNAFINSDYYQLYLDAAAIKILEEEGLGTVNKDGDFVFSETWLEEKHKEFSTDTKNDTEAKNPKFGGTLYTYAPSERVKEEMKKRMDNARSSAAEKLGKKIEAYFKEKEKKAEEKKK